MQRTISNIKKVAGLATIAALVHICACPPVRAQCSGAVPETALTATDQTGTDSTTRQLVSGTATSISTSTPGQISVNVTTVPIANGGTGQTTADTALNALTGSNTTGDILYYNSTSPAKWVHLPIGSNGQFLQVSSGLPAWGTGGGGSAPSSCVTVNNETSSFPNSRQLSAGTGTTVSTTSTQISVNLSTPVSLSNGGTGYSAASTQALLDNLMGSSTTGDLSYYNGTSWVHLGIGSSGQTLQVSSGVPAWGAAPTGGLSALKTSNQSVTSSTTLQDDTALTLSLAANTSYAFKLVVYFLDASNGTADLKYSLNWGGGGTFQWSSVAKNSGNNVDIVDVITANSTTAAAGGVSSTTARMVVIEGTVLNSSGAAGTLKLQWAQNTSNSNAVTVQAGSRMSATPF